MASRLGQEKSQDSEGLITAHLVWQWVWAFASDPLEHALERDVGSKLLCQPSKAMATFLSVKKMSELLLVIAKSVMGAFLRNRVLLASLLEPRTGFRPGG
ncbi:hypothetical protein mvi_64070 (plasmid) [Methylobacterium indicum]|uniref:Uncharacterized protein n=1 Tax=Methylobacterium indicum TaxID=1775910 RepID=A0A8H9CAL7_9HYPH|nr:hypothetical protein mvi_64070 [Methylobacterium indicum]